MTQNTTTEAPATNQANIEKIGSKPRKHRMAREPKADDQGLDGDTKLDAKNTKASAPKEPRGPSKIASVVTLLEREQGATLAEMVEATGWLPHTTRAALTGLKKKGHTIAKDKRGEVTCYHLVKAA